jgi:hypothetical protein
VDSNFPIVNKLFYVPHKIKYTLTNNPEDSHYPRTVSQRYSTYSGKCKKLAMELDLMRGKTETLAEEKIVLHRQLTQAQVGRSESALHPLQYCTLRITGRQSFWFNFEGCIQTGNFIL